MNQKTGAIINLPHSVEIIRIVFYCFVSRAEDNLARGFVLSPLIFKFNLLLEYSKENVYISIVKIFSGHQTIQQFTFEGLPSSV